MANSNREQNVETNQTADELWVQAAAARKYGIHNGKPYVGVDGVIVSLSAPAWFAGVPNGAIGATVCDALLQNISYRVIQPLVKAGKKSRDEIQAAAQAAVDNGYEPSARDKDPVEDEVNRVFRSKVDPAVLAKRPDATPDQLEAYAEKFATTDRGTQIRDAARAEILARGTYQTVKRGKKADIGDLGLDNLDI